MFIHFARSGNSPESVAVLDLALKYFPDQMGHVVITCNREGKLAQMAGNYPEQVYLIVLPDTSNDQALAITSSFIPMVLTAQALAYLESFDTFQPMVH